jgi:hypothetical protein
METIVVDLGCCPHNGDVSVGRLVDRHHPQTLYGFDPLLESDFTYRSADTDVILEKKAAWTGDGKGLLGVGGEDAWSLLNATLIRDKTAENEWRKEVEVEFFDFGAWILDAKLENRLIVKMNVEGAEFPLLQDLYDRKIDGYIDLLYVSWHDDRMGGGYPTWREWLDKRLRCPIEPWSLW